VSLSRVTFLISFQPRDLSVSASSLPIWLPTTSPAFISFEKPSKIPSPSSVIVIGYEKQNPMYEDLSLRCSRLSANLLKNSFFESSRSMPGIDVFSMNSIAAFPCASKVTRQERKFVPPASMTMTLLPATASSGGRQYVRIMSSAAARPASPSFISKRSDSIIEFMSA